MNGHKKSPQTFGVQALNQQGEMVTLTFNASSEHAARERVQQQGLSIQRIYQFPLMASYASMPLHTIPPEYIKLTLHDQGIELSRPLRKRDVMAGIVNFLTWGGIGTFSTLGMIAMYFERPLQLDLWLNLWSVGCFLLWGGFFVLPYVQRLWGYEQIVVTDDTLTLKYGLFRRKSAQYHLNNIKNFRLIIAGNSRHGRILFDHHTETIQCWKQATLDEARALLKYVTDIMTYHCHSVQRVVFGELRPVQENPYMILYNPTVSELTTPLFHLKQILIHTETYQFHQVEQFITYVINSLGQRYLKQSVEASVFGDPTNLHPNLRNTLTNLCHDVVFRKAEDLITYFGVEKLA